MYFVFQTHQPIWRICPDVENTLVAIECRDRNEPTIELLILDLEKQLFIASQAFTKETVLLNFVNQIIFTGQVNTTNDISLPQSITIFDNNIKQISEIPEVYFHSIVKLKNDFELIFSLYGKLYSLPFNSFVKNEEVETTQINTQYLERDELKHLPELQSYLPEHTHYSDLVQFIERAAYLDTTKEILYSENEHFLVCSFLNTAQQNQLLITDRTGKTLFNEVIAEKNKKPLEVMLFGSYVLWVSQHELHVFLED